MNKFIPVAATIFAVIANPASAKEGFYVGAIGGYDDVTLTADGEKGSSGDLMYGAVFGYDHNTNGQTILGMEVELSDSSVSSTYRDGEDYFRLSAGREIYIGPRVGVMASEDTMIYFKAGYVNGQVKGTLAYDGEVASDNLHLDGYRIGGGVEHYINRVAVRVEYRYSDFGSANYEGYELGVSARRHQFVAGLVGKF